MYFISNKIKNAPVIPNSGYADCLYHFIMFRRHFIFWKQMGILWRYKISLRVIIVLLFIAV